MLTQNQIRIARLARKLGFDIIGNVRHHKTFDGVAAHARLQMDGVEVGMLGDNGDGGACQVRIQPPPGVSEACRLLARDGLSQLVAFAIAEGDPFPEEHVAEALLTYFEARGEYKRNAKKGTILFSRSRKAFEAMEFYGRQASQPGTILLSRAYRDTLAKVLTEEMPEAVVLHAVIDEVEDGWLETTAERSKPGYVDPDPARRQPAVKKPRRSRARAATGV